jgi:putative transposase
MNCKTLPQRHSIRKKGYIYSTSGYYFVTVCVDNAQCNLGNITDGIVHLSSFGKIIQNCILSIPSFFAIVTIDTLIIMPNHLHVILIINNDNSNDKTTLGQIVRHFKAKSTRLIHQEGGTTFAWQRNYYDHIIRKERSLNLIRLYIKTNPLFWQYDVENPNPSNKNNLDAQVKAIAGMNDEEYELIRNYIEYRNERKTRAQ